MGPVSKIANWLMKTSEGLHFITIFYLLMGTMNFFAERWFSSTVDFVLFGLFYIEYGKKKQDEIDEITKS